VKLTLLRPWGKDEMPSDSKYVLGKPYTVTVRRDKIESPNTETKLLEGAAGGAGGAGGSATGGAGAAGGKVGYVRLFEFNQKATDELRREYEDLIKRGAKSLILDLRENPGGDLQQAIGVSSLFIKSGPIVQIESRGRKKPEVLDATGKTLSRDLPLVCLVDANSASASEIVSAALQDYKRAVLVGVTTFGKGSVQTQLPYDEGAVFMTTAHYLSAKGRTINDVGTKPDIVVEMELSKQSEESSDTQLQRAIAEAQSQAQAAKETAREDKNE
jgi:C-terminal peptidase prc